MINQNSLIKHIFVWCYRHWDWLLSGLLHVLLILVLVIATNRHTSVTIFNTAARMESKNNTPPVAVIQAQTISARALDDTIAQVEAVKHQQALAIRQAERKAAQERQRQAQQHLAAQQKKAAAAAEKAKLEQQKKAAEAAEKTKLEQQKKAAEAAEKAKLEQQKTAAQSAEKAKLEQQKTAAEAAEEAKLEQQKTAAQSAEKAKLAKLRALGTDSIAQAVQQEQAQSAAAQRAATEKEKYMGLIQQLIRSNWINQLTTDANLTVTLQIQLDTSGNVLDVTVLKSSGDATFDRQAVLAVRKSSPLPLPEDQALANQFRHLVMPFSQ